MFNLKKCIVLSVLSVFAFVINTHAAELSSKCIFETRANGALGQIVTVSGHADEAAGKRVSLKIWEIGKTAEDFTDNFGSDGVEMEMFAIFKQTTADSSGKFSFEFPFNKPYGTYKADVMIEDYTEQLHLDISVGDVEPINNLLNKVNDTAKIAQVTDTDILNFLDAAENYGIDTSIYVRMSEGKEQTAAAMLKEIKAKRALNEKITIENLTDIVCDCIILTVFSSSNDGQLLCDTLSVYEEYLGLDNLTDAEKIYDTYKSLKSMNQCALRLGGKTYTTIQELVDAWKEAVILQAVSEAGYYTELKPIISDNADYLFSGEEYAKYYKDYNDSAAIQEYVLKQVIGKKLQIRTVDNFRDEFVSAVNNYGSGGNSNSGGNSGGASGGSSGGASGGISKSSVSYIDPKVTQPDKAQPINQVVLTDIKGHWAENAVNDLVKKGIVSGNPDGTFTPEANITREEFVKMIVQAFDIYENAGGNTDSFEDVPETRWSFSYISAAASRGVVSGTGDSKFMPQATITREDMAAILYRAICLAHTPTIRGDVENQFKDFDTISDYAQNSVMILSYLEIVNGDGEKFNPKENAKRSEAAQILYKALKVVETNEY